jgi:cellulase/cellobiase CelA1
LASDLAQGEGEGSTHLAENAQSAPVKQVKEEMGTACADSFGSLKAGSSAGQWFHRTFFHCAWQSTFMRPLNLGSL